MESSEFIKNCQLAEDSLRKVLQNIDENNKEVYWCLNDAVNILSILAIPEGPFIGRSVMKCLLIEEEDDCNSMECEKEILNRGLRRIRLLFDAMDETGITRMNREVFKTILSTFLEDVEIITTFEESDEAQKDYYKSQIQEIMTARPDYFEMGNPESDIICDESCRGTKKVISRTQLGEGISRTATTRPDSCLYKDWL